MTTQTTVEPYTFSDGDRICVTGGGGFIGRHVVASLLSVGAKITATVRNTDQAESIMEDIGARVGDAIQHLDIVKADLTDDAGWAAAFSGCKAVVHTASPFPNKPPKSPNDLIKVAVDGTQRVLSIAHQSNIKRVVLTSSVATMVMQSEFSGAVEINETQWSDPDCARIDGYTKSKLRAERLAWQLADELDLQLTVLNPGLVFGTPIGQSAGTSVGMIKRVFNGKDIAMPDAGFPCVAVRDVALAHVKALQTPASIGHRMALCERTFSMVEIARLLKKSFPSKRIATLVAPTIIIRLAAKFDPELQTLLPFLGYHPNVLHEKATQILNMDFTDVNASIVETAKNFVGASKETAY